MRFNDLSSDFMADGTVGHSLLMLTTKERKMK